MRGVNKGRQANLRLKRLYDARVRGMNQDEFGAKYGIGSQGMVSQYLTGHRPLNLEAAAKFARGLRCTIYEISPEMAETIRHEILPVLGIDSKPIVPINLATRIRARREELGLTVSQLAESAGVAQVLVHQWESGDTEDLSHQHLFAIADVLKTDPRQLALGGRQHGIAEAEAPTPSNSFWERVQTASRYAGIDERQSAIAKFLGLSRQTVNRWVKYGAMANAETMAIIARKLGTDHYWLATGQGQMVPGTAPPAGERGRAHRRGATDGG
jgi:transcriptional regulator with XRE-family HTH domain